MMKAVAPAAASYSHNGAMRQVTCSRAYKAPETRTTCRAV